MTGLAEEAARLMDSLSPEKARALIEYARYLAEKTEQEEWEQMTSNPQYREKLLKASEEAWEEYKAGKTTRLDPDRL